MQKKIDAEEVLMTMIQQQKASPVTPSTTYPLTSSPGESSNASWQVMEDDGLAQAFQAEATQGPQ